jgi:hypothetical protein
MNRPELFSDAELSTGISLFLRHIERDPSRYGMDGRKAYILGGQPGAVVAENRAEKPGLFDPNGKLAAAKAESERLSAQRDGQRRSNGKYGAER